MRQAHTARLFYIYEMVYNIMYLVILLELVKAFPIIA